MITYEVVGDSMNTPWRKAIRLAAETWSYAIVASLGDDYCYCLVPCEAVRGCQTHELFDYKPPKCWKVNHARVHRYMEEFQPLAEKRLRSIK